MHEHRRRVQAQHLEHIGALVKIDHCKEQIVGVALRVAIRIGDNRVLVVRMATDNALSARCHCREHNYYRVIAWCHLHQIPESIAIEFQHRSLIVQVEQMLNTFA